MRHTGLSGCRAAAARAIQVSFTPTEFAEPQGCVAILPSYVNRLHPPQGYPRELLSLGDHVKARRLDLRLTQKQVAATIGVKSDSVRNWETGRSEPGVRYYPRLISFLGYNPLPESETRGQANARERMTRELSRKRQAKLTRVDEATIRRLEADRRGCARRPAEIVCTFLRIPTV